MTDSATTAHSPNPNPKPSLLWQLSAFAELNGYQVYNIIRAREQVFVRDQQCTYVDADGVDFEALHLAAYEASNADSNSSQVETPALAAYCRIIPPSTLVDNYPTKHPRIGRVLVRYDYRGLGLARELMIKAIEYCHSSYPYQPIDISAQTYLIAFYESLGFVCIGDIFDEEGVEHIHMVLAY